MATSFRLNRDILFIFLLAIFSCYVRYHPIASPLVVIDDDIRQHVYWTARFQDPSLFRDDLLTDFISTPLFDPWGYQFIYWMGTRFLDPLPLSQLVTLGLLLLSLGLLIGLARNIVGEGRGVMISTFLFLFFSLYTLSGGIPRTFALPLLLLFLYLLYRKGPFYASMVIPIEALVYPPILLNTLALAVPYFLRRWRNSKGVSLKGLIRDLLPFGITCALALALLITVYIGYDHELLGSRVTLEEARGMPEFYPGGRSKFFRESPLEYFVMGRSGIGVTYLIGFAIIFTFLCGLRRLRGIRVPALVIDLVATSLVLFVIAHIFLFRLHLPSRYTLFTLPLAFILLIGANMPSLSLRVSDRLGRAVWILIWILFPLYSWLQGNYICRADPLEVTIEPADMELYAFLSRLPRDALIAGHPMDMDNVPLFAKRRVLVNHELSLPYYLGYYKKIRERTFRLLRAYYTDDVEELKTFLDAYGVDYLVVRPLHFEGNFLKGRIYYEPFNAFVKDLLRERRVFLLADPPKGWRCFENRRYVVIESDRIRR